MDSLSSFWLIVTIGYARVRYVNKDGNVGDFARTLRHRTVMAAIYDKMMKKLAVHFNPKIFLNCGNKGFHAPIVVRCINLVVDRQEEVFDVDENPGNLKEMDPESIQLDSASWTACHPSG